LVSRPALAAVGARLGLLDRARLGRSLQGVGDTFGLSGLIYESVVGAVYLDGGLEAARSFVLRTMGDAIDEGIAAPSPSIDRRAPQRSPKTTLQELAQTRIGTVPLYRTVEVSGPDHRRQYVVEVELDSRRARGTGMSMRDAQEAAASALLDEIER
jgi:ribonuclease-3